LVIQEYGLGDLVAGNFHRNKFSGDVTKRLICLSTVCSGVPFPAVMQGVNDLPECQSPEAWLAQFPGGSAPSFITEGQNDNVGLRRAPKAFGLSF